MKIGDRAMPKSSFGLPKMEEATQTEVLEVPEESKPEETKTEVDVIQESLGVKFTQDDFDQLLMKGYCEKEIEIIKGKLRATFRSLTVDEWHESDEVYVEEVQNNLMTKEGADVRQGLIRMVFSLTHLQGRVLAQPVKKQDGSIDKKATAGERMRHIKAMSPSVVNIMLGKYVAFNRMIDLITMEPEKYLKNS